MSVPTALKITQKDGSVWAVPVSVIARNRADHYKDEFGGDLDRSLKEDTMALFAESEYEIQDWAANNMDWDEVVPHAVKLADAPPLTDDDFQEAWVNGEKELAGSDHFCKNLKD